MRLIRLLARLLLGRRLPRTSGTLRLPGPRATLHIRRDEHGIPVIQAGTDHDAWFGLGFCHGQDRAFQLEIIQRLIRGTLAELVGLPGLPVDRLSRRVGFHHAAKQQLPLLEPTVRDMLQAYVAGINAGHQRGLPARPHEFVLLGARPSSWEPADVLGYFKLQSFVLASNWDAELARQHILTEDGPEALAAVNPLRPGWLPAQVPTGAATGEARNRLAEDIRQFTALTGIGGGSNAWVLAGSRTATGRPLLANDPHLAPLCPSQWYLARLQTPEWSAAGATFVGIPAIAIGHNGHIAWGVTAGLADNTDLFLEQVGPDGHSVRQGERFVPCGVRREIIHVKGGKPVVEEVLQTPRGPIISPALPEARAALSLRATWLDARPIKGLLGLTRARSFEEFQAVFRDWPCGTMNMLYADVQGTIAYQMVGLVPRRKKGWGLVPAPGWDEEAGWHDKGVPFEEMPCSVRQPGENGEPGRDFYATANAQPRPEGEGPWLGQDFMDGYRQAAILEAVSARRDWDVLASLRLQTSQLSLPWREMRQAVLAVPAGDERTALAVRLLRAWDGVVGAESPAAAIYELFVAELASRLVRAKAPRSHAWALGQGHSLLTPVNFFCYRYTGTVARLVREQPSGWFSRSWPEEMADVLASVVQRLRSEQGPEPENWAWGRLRTLVLRHALAAKKVLAPLFNLGPVPCGGDNDTIAQASILPLNPLLPTDNIVSLRVVLDVGAWENCRFVLPTGQSGNPFSPHYGDLFPRWQRGAGVPIPWTDQQIARSTRQTLTLEPQRRTDNGR